MLLKLKNGKLIATPNMTIFGLVNECEKESMCVQGFLVHTSVCRSYNENPKQRRNAMRHLIDMHLNDLLF